MPTKGRRTASRTHWSLRAAGWLLTYLAVGALVACLLMHAKLPFFVGSWIDGCHEWQRCGEYTPATVGAAAIFWPVLGATWILGAIGSGVFLAVAYAGSAVGALVLHLCCALLTTDHTSFRVLPPDPARHFRFSTPFVQEPPSVEFSSKEYQKTPRSYAQLCVTGSNTIFISSSTSSSVVEGSSGQLHYVFGVR